MDESFRKAERDFLASNDKTAQYKLFRSALRSGLPIELCSEVCLDRWDEKSFKDLIGNLPKTQLIILGRPLKIKGASRSPLISVLRTAIAEEFNSLFYEQEIQEARSAINGEFNVVVF